jgi:outer membrane protein OmpA-like peptidoglycan-associated protein
MSYQVKSHLGWGLAKLLVVAVLWTFSMVAAAQDPPGPKVELFGGYSFFYPNADVHGQLPQALFPISSRLESNPRGAGASITYDFNRWFGLTLDSSMNWGSGEATVANRINDTAFGNLSLGPKITFRTHRFSPFVEGLIGDHRLTPDAFHDVDKLGFMFGGGLDINLSRHVALRLFRADFVYSNYSFGPPSVPHTDIRGVRAQAGLNFMLGGGAPELPASAACSAQPSEVFAGEPVTATASGSNFNPKRSVKYHWDGTSVKVSGSDAATQIDTTGLPPGRYQATANLSDGSKHGNASCTAMFAVKTPHPPTIACSSNPGTVRTGDSATITSVAGSPDSRRLTYSYSASAGNISGADATASLDTHGAQPGVITVTCNVSDDRVPSLTASSSSVVNVEAPPPPPVVVKAPPPEIKELEVKLALHSVYFPTARPSPTNPGGGLVDSQETILKTLAADFKSYLKYLPDAHLILGGHADPRGSVEYNKALSQRRVDRTRSFLVENGVPEDHIDVRSFGDEDQLTPDQIKQQIADNPDLTPADRREMLNNFSVMVLANNRRVDITLSTTGEQSTHRYPFNARDYLSLVNAKNSEKKPAVKKKSSK